MQATYFLVPFLLSLFFFSPLLLVHLGEQRPVWILPLENQSNKMPHPAPCLDAPQKHFEVLDVLGPSDSAPPAL